MIITLVGGSINGSQRNWVKSLQNHLDAVAKLLNANFFREYRLVLDYKEYKIRVPIIKDTHVPVLLWPGGLLRRRPYPLAVYLFAVCMYLAGGVTMREAATQTRKQFGLDKFSHSTLSRARKKLLQLLLDHQSEFTVLESECDEHSSLLARLTHMLKGIISQPFFHSVQLAYHFYQRYQIFML